MMYNRLITFGCSLTYGHGLKDCYSGRNRRDAGSKPSKLAWPALVAYELGLQCVNMSYSGASNKRIWYTCKNFRFKKRDIAVILWTYSNRYCVIEEDGSITDLLLTKFKKSRLEKAYKSLYRENDSKIDSVLRLHNTIDHLNHLQIPNYHVVCDSGDFINQKDKLLPFTMDNVRRNFDKGVDNIHPGRKAHEHFAGLILNHIRNTL